MQIDAAFVAELAGLAKLSVPAADAERLSGELTRILDYVEQLQAAATDPAPAAGAVRRRDDDPEAPTGPALLSASAGLFGRFIRVPVVIGEEAP